MVITSEQKLNSSNYTFNKPVKALASLISYLFHPLFIPLYVTYYIAFINPEFFTGLNDKARYYVLVWIFINMLFFPALAVLLLKGVGFIDSIFLKTQRDRIIPYIAANLFYFWMFLVFHNNHIIPVIITSFVLGVFLTSSIALIANIYFKISMHAMGMGGALGILMVILFKTDYTVGISVPIMFTVLLTGVVCSSRMIVSDHTPKEIYIGLIVGILFQFIATSFVF